VPSLRETQAAFAASVFAPGGGQAAGLIRDGGIAPERRLEIYRNNVFSALRGALRDSYPVILRLLGEAFFNHVATAFVRAHPSRSGDLHDFGGEFADFLGSFPACADYPYLPDVARLEWTCDRVFHAAEHPPFDLARIREVPAEAWAGLRLRMHPASGLVGSAYPILRIWQVNQEGYDGEPAVDLALGGVNVLITRPEFTLQLEAIPAGDFAFLSALAGGATLGESLDAATQADAEFELGAALSRHLAAGVIVDLDRGPT
jgi:Putative DNA-binding domain